MHEKIEVVYIGPKKFKRDTICNTRTIFPQFKPVPVPVDIAYQLTEYPTVWKYKSELEDYLCEQEELKKAKAAEQEDERKRLAQEAFENSTVVTLNGEELDISKYTEVQLKTLVEGEELNVEPKQQGETVADYRMRVRDAIRDIETSQE